MSAWSKKKLGRRLFLGGAGAAIALPFLPSAARLVSPGVARAGGEACDAAPKRLLAWYVPCGIHMANWRPSGTGTEFELPSTLQPLEPVRSKVNILSGLENVAARPDQIGDHASGTGAFITAFHVRKSDSDIQNGVSMDQVAAMHIGSCTRFASLELGADGGGSAGNCDNGYSCAYVRNIAWAGPSTPLPKIVDPRVAFDRLFQGFDPNASAAEIARRRAYSTSVLDSALDDANSLRPRLGSSDQHKLDEYLTALREVEMRISTNEEAICEIPQRPEGDLDVTTLIDVMSDLQTIALQCDLTRVITFMVANGGSNRSYPFLGFGDGHHNLSHHQGNAENHRKLSAINRWEIERFSYFLQKLDAVEEGEGTLLDSCVAFLSSEISDGDAHNHNDMPVLVAGSAGGAFETGRHVRYDGNPPVANLFIKLLNSVDVPVTSFGQDGREPLAL